MKKLNMRFGTVLLICGTLMIPSRAASRTDEAGPSAVTVKIRPEEADGKIKKVNGGNLAAPLEDEEQPGGNIREAFLRLNVPVTRLHDVPLQNAGMRLVDVPLIFANFGADAEDPSNYYFTQTDDYIKNCIDCGSAVYYRLGPSIEHSVNKYFVHPPEDTDKWIDIVSNIIRHYTEGKWNGFHYDITYWEIWNEPDLGPKMWTGTLAEFNDFYVKVATELKKRFPHLKFGGPGQCVFEEQRVREFIGNCAKHRAPLDFYSFHIYAPDDKAILQMPFDARRYLNEYGYEDTEIHLNEWHYNPHDGAFWAASAPQQAEWIKFMRGLESAAFLNTVMIGWQDTPLDMGFYYTMTTTRWGLFEHGEPEKTYYGMLAFGELTRYGDRIKLTADGLPEGSRALASKDAQGNVAVLVACWKSGPLELTFDVGGMGDFVRTEVYLLDETHDLDKVVELGRTDTPVKIGTVSGSGVVLVKLFRN